MTIFIRTLLTIFSFCWLTMAYAGEGMWLPQLLKALNENEMHTMGMKMSAEDIYSVNKGSLKDAIVHFGGGCTSEIISADGLLLTNHHCGYGQIQAHSTIKNNYLEHGFWAMSRDKELPNQGLTATFIVRIEDVSKVILLGLNDDMDASNRQSTIDKNIETYKASMKLNKHEEAVIKPFFKGNQYFMFITMTYRDVRLVGTPPSSIGKFGADTDNWVWPRHTGDFSLFRIYAGKDNLPADYSEDNIPFTPKHFLPISLDGVKEGDFTMVFGFPGRTNEYLPVPAVEQIMKTIDPTRIAIRDASLKIIDAEMRADPSVKIQYSSKFARIANGWKKWQGEILGLTKTKALDKKKDYENNFNKKVVNNEKWKKEYGHILGDFAKYYKEIEPYAFTREYYYEVAYRNIELLGHAARLGQLVTAYEESGAAGFEEMKAKYQPRIQRFYKDYQPKVDQKVFAKLMEMYFQNVRGEYVPEQVRQMVKAASRDFDVLAKRMYEQSNIANGDKMMQWLEEKPAVCVANIKKDRAFVLSQSMQDIYNERVAPKYTELQAKIADLQRIYMKAQMEVFSTKRFYPDANGTMRITYGNVAAYQPRDAVNYTPVTYLSGVMEKYVPEDYEFDVPKKLRDLYKHKDYGQYAENGKMPVCFIGSNHTSGGNSGSPAIDAHGNLIGLNFDRVWEGTMSDINYDASICRNIMVDIRYVLFIIDKYAGAGHLVEEMTLVHPKKLQKNNIKNELVKKKKFEKKKQLKMEKNLKIKKKE